MRRTTAIPSATGFSGKRASVLPRKSIHSVRPKCFDETDQHLVESYGVLLPIAVSDVLSSCGPMCGNIDSQNSIAFLISGRTLYLWGLEKASTLNKRFPLPVSEIALQYRHVSITAFAKTICLVVVSPAGNIRFWKSIKSPNTTTFQEAVLPLQGQEVHSVVQVTLEKMAIVTTNGRFYFVVSDAKCGFSLRELKFPSTGVAGKLSSMASYLWGSQSNETVTTKRLLVSVKSEDSIIFMTSTTLTKINIISEQIEWSLNLQDILKRQIVISLPGFNSESMAVAFIDACFWADESDIVIACAVWDASTTTCARYILCHLQDVSNGGPDFNVMVLCSNLSLPLNEGSPIIDFHLLFPYPRFCEPFLMNDRQVIRLSVKSSDADLDTLDFSIGEDRLLSFGVFKNELLMISPSKGFVRFLPKGSKIPREFRSKKTLQETLETIASNFAEPSRQLRQMFILFSDAPEYSTEFIEIFDSFFADQNRGFDNSPLDVMILDCALSLSDESFAHSEMNLADLDIQAMLESKRDTLNKFVRFCNDCLLLEKSQSVLFGKRLVPTIDALHELVEKIESLTIFHKYHCVDSNLFDSCINVLVHQRNHISTTDTWMLQFYRTISSMDEIFYVLSENQKNGNVPFSPKSFVSLTQLYVEIHRACYQLRKNAFRVGSGLYVPWTLSSEFYHTIKLHLQWGNDQFNNECGGEFYECQYQLACTYLENLSIYFDGCGDQGMDQTVIDTVDNAWVMDMVDSVRSEFTTIFESAGKKGLALMLAERYLDWDTLFELCDSDDNLWDERMGRYIEMYKGRDVGGGSFLQRLCQWLYNHRRLDRLSEMPHSHELVEVLQDAPKILLKVQDRAKDHEGAVQTYVRLVQDEQNLKQRFTYTSFGRLKARCGGPELEKTHYVKWLIDIKVQCELQSALPAWLKSEHGLGQPDEPVLPTHTIVRLYLSEQRPSDESEQEKLRCLNNSLGLVKYIDPKDELWEQCIELIWSTACNWTNWDSIDVNSPQSSSLLRECIFYRLLISCIQGFAPIWQCRALGTDLVITPDHLMKVLSEEESLDEKAIALAKHCYEDALTPSDR